MSDEAPAHWLDGTPMDPFAVSLEPLPQLPGFPFMHEGSCAVIVGPTGGGRSSLVQAGLYDAALAGLRCAYLGSEVTPAEFNARAAALAGLRGHTIDDAARKRLARVRYLELASTLVKAWKVSEPDDWMASFERVADEPTAPTINRWVQQIAARFQLIAIDPLSSVASALDLDFDRSNADFIQFYDRLISPLTAAGVAVVMLDNIGHAEDAKRRAKGASAKQDRADLTFSCAPCATPPGLILKAGKVRSIRAGFQRGDEWLFTKDTQQIISRERTPDETPGGFRPTAIMQRVSEAVERDPGLSKRAIRTVQGKNDWIDLALELLITEGYITTEPAGRAVRHTSVKPYRGDNRAPVPPTCPDRGPGTVPTDRAPVPPTCKEGHGHGHGTTTHNNGTAPTTVPPREVPT